MAKQITPPTVRAGERVRERWEIEVSQLLTGADISLDDLSQLFFTLLSDNSADFDIRLSQLERQATHSRTEDLEEKIKQLERRIEWLSLQKSS